MANSKKEIFEDDLDVVVGGANTTNNTTNTNTNNTTNTVGGNSNKVFQQGKNNSVKNSTIHMGNSVSQVNNIKDNKGDVKVDKPFLIENAGNGNVYHL